MYIKLQGKTVKRLNSKINLSKSNCFVLVLTGKSLLEEEYPFFLRGNFSISNYNLYLVINYVDFKVIGDKD